MEANLLVTYDPAHPGKAEKEMLALLDSEEKEMLESPISGVFLLKTGKDAKEVVKELRDRGKESFESTFRWVPIDEWMDTDLEKMIGAVKKYNDKIGEDESWKMDLHKRGYDAHSTLDLIKALTDVIDRKKVDLKNPQKIIAVEIMGEKAGLSLLEADEYLDMHRM